MSIANPIPSMPASGPKRPAADEAPPLSSITVPVSGSHELEPLPRDPAARELTVRAIATGMVLGAALSLCNIYSGLKIGWSLNMSITAALLGYGFWALVGKVTRRDQLGILETNINQTAASAGASVSSAGLVAPIPALTMLTGQTLPWPLLATWVFSVCLVGIGVAVSLRRQMLIEERLPFPFGIASAETLREMYAKGAEAMARIKWLLGGGLVAAVIKLIEGLTSLGQLALPGRLSIGAAGSATLNNLGFALSPTLLMPAVGAVIGMRAAASLMAGTVLAWGVVAPLTLANGWVQPGAADAMWFGALNKWVLWPGVALMVTASLTSFAFNIPRIVASLRERAKARAAAATHATPNAGGDDGEDVPRRWLLPGLGFALALSALLQWGLFDVVLWIAVLGVLMTFVLAVVAARVSGETGITPVGPMGKVTQLLFGALAPGQAAANLMAANVTGGAASQCGDLLHDMRAGHLLGARARLQAVAQLFGALAGATAGSAVYLVLIPDPQNQLLTAEWPAPAAAAWMAVAEVFMKGVSALPEAAPVALMVGGAAGVLLALAEKLAPKRIGRFLPSAVSLGLAFVVPAYISLAMFLGAVVAAGLKRWVSSWSARFLVVTASGAIAGESLTGVGLAIRTMLAG